MGNVYKVLGSQKTINKEPSAYADRLVIELCENIHIHYRNIRWELNEAEFFKLADAMREAVQDYKLYVGKKQYALIPLLDINPYDAGHSEQPDELHRLGIDGMKVLVKSGKKLLPILVKRAQCEQPRFLRLDGYKRYMAYKELGYTKIECFVDNDGSKGDQTSMDLIWE